MRYAFWVLVALVVLLLVGVLPTAEGPPITVFRSPVFIALLGMVGMSCVACCVSLIIKAIKQREFRLKQVGCLLTHASVLLILAGACMKLIYGQEGNFVLLVGSPAAVNHSHPPEISLDFGVSATDLQISYYDPNHYDLFIPREDASPKEDYEFSRKIAVPPDGGALVVDDTVRVALSEIRTDKGEWMPFHYLADGSILQINRSVRHYSAMLHFEKADSEKISEEVAVNHPVNFDGWRFYLMSAKEGQPYILLSGKRDPGWPLVRSGIWMMMVGVSIMCFRKTGEG